ncbi:MAG: hypothetical protein A3A27_01205 [Candidatus Wildermuthbacteria bacterium RIFCSPLOWO2_01_FULL_47_18]|uniref:Rod shape-determining protein MreD n=2 Tax=Candidatus Wildermuthiibacteriota TaxID=1817923 RepID=A0A1G2RHI7_9BACT|nr:MAG: hypothetical protein A3J68_02515 [Candidatus Wildermuthbacteria bacterium RIFCSPHIGHO2_02_FULL_48_16]OHA72324.1 MAG: hypothetical protein A3A27_01205 [Candidatus Wildermuthbacteria bacterium RIFCSPLOWO2_01_FULL_47_18]
MKVTNTQLLITFTVVIAVLSFGARLLPHLPNFTPIGALALFAGAYLAKKHWWGLFVPLFIMFVSDLFIGFYDVKLMAVVYGSFLLYALIGRVLPKQNPLLVLGGALGGAVFFYLATNFAVWMFSPWYEKSVEGLMLSYTLALPFFRATLLGDLLFTGMFFGAYEFAKAYLFKTKPSLVSS